MMMPARIAIIGAVMCTLWFNGSYAWSKGGALPHQLSMVALALTIDLCKASFLPAASILWRQNARVPAFLVMALWPFALGYSTFAGYAYLTTHRTEVALEDEAQANRRRVAQTDYDRILDELETARASSIWKTTAACTDPRSERHRNFCSSARATEIKLNEVSAALAAQTPAQADPELAVLAELTGWRTAFLTIVIAVVPALLLELIASIGPYAVARQSHSEASRTSFTPQTTSTSPRTGKSPEMAPAQPDPHASAAMTAPPQMSWSIPSRR